MTWFNFNFRLTNRIIQLYGALSRTSGDKRPGRQVLEAIPLQNVQPLRDISWYNGNRQIPAMSKVITM